MLNAAPASNYLSLAGRLDTKETAHLAPSNQALLNYIDLKAYVKQLIQSMSNAMDPRKLGVLNDSWLDD